jgi:hypothetical protein
MLERIFVIFEIIHYSMSGVRVHSKLADKLQHLQHIEHILRPKTLEKLEEAN